MKEKKTSRLAIILPIFFLSGSAGGIYEIVWTKQLLLIFGATAFAVSTVLTAYMAGLAIGSYFFGKLIDRKPRNPAVFFSQLEMGIGICGLLIIFIIPVISKLYSLLYPFLLSNYYIKNLVRFVFCFILLLPPTILMGGTLPVLSRGLFTRENVFGRYLGDLYGINTIGAMFGAFVVGFIFMPKFGIAFSTISAVILNGICVILAFSVKSRYSTMRESSPEAVQKEGMTGEKPGAAISFDSRSTGLILLWVAAVAGFTSMSYEVIYTRLLKLVFNNTTYSFTTILVSFLAGIGLGSLISSRYADRVKNGLLVIGIMQFMLGVMAIWAMPMIFNSQDIIHSVNDIFGGIGWEGYSISRFTISFLVLIGVAALSGATFPLVIKLRRKESHSTGTRVGEIYSINTIAAVMGSFSGGFIIIPVLGTYWGLISLVSLNALIGIFCVYRSKSTHRQWRLAMLGIGLLLVFVSVTMNPRITFLGKLKKPKEKVQILHMDEGSSASIYILQNVKTGERTLHTGGIHAMGTNYESLQTVRLLGHLPLLLCQNPKTVLVIGFGIGKTVSSIAKHPVEKIDCVEIVPEVLESAHYFRDLNEDVLSDPRLNAVVDDGRSFLFGIDMKYDVISCDPIHPAFGSPALYTKEYFEKCYEKLNDGGVMVQYLPFHQLSTPDFLILLNTFQSVFPHTSIWLASYHGIMLGRKNPKGLNPIMLEQRLNNKEVSNDLEDSNIHGLEGILSRMILGEAQIKAMLSGTEDLNTDNHSVIEYAESRFFKRKTWIDNMKRIITHMTSIPYPELFDQRTFDEGMEDYYAKIYRARLHAIQARLYFEMRMPDRAVRELSRLLEISKGDPETLTLAGAGLREHFVKRARQLFHKGDSAGALKIIEKAIDLGLGSADLYVELGVLRYSAGDRQGAVEALEQALKENPNHPEASQMLSHFQKSQ